MTDAEITVIVPPDVLRLSELAARELKTAATHTAQQTAERVRENLIEDDKVVSSALLDSIDYEVEMKDDAITAEVFSTELHSFFIEEGREPGYVSPDIILEWMMDKGITPRDGETMEQAAQAIAHYITEHGFEGTAPFARALEDSIDAAQAEAVRAADRLAVRFAR